MTSTTDAADVVVTISGSKTVTIECDERHCDEEHPDLGNLEDLDEAIDARESLATAMTALVEAHHREHDARFPWSLCSRDTCRETAIALGMR